MAKGSVHPATFRNNQYPFLSIAIALYRERRIFWVIATSFDQNPTADDILFGNDEIITLVYVAKVRRKSPPRCGQIFLFNREPPHFVFSLANQKSKVRIHLRDDISSLICFSKQQNFFTDNRV
tara:strand:+ start:511 stop:879 length:369 start_codon:yes stop_codon:yes gene_type:complete